MISRFRQRRLGTILYGVDTESKRGSMTTQSGLARHANISLENSYVSDVDQHMYVCKIDSGALGVHSDV